MIIDTHIHLNDEKYLENLDFYLKEAEIEGVNHFFCVGWDLESSKKAIELAKKYTKIHAIVGIMPTSHETFNENSMTELEELIKNNLDVVIAIGEIGLDYYWEKEIDIKNKQKMMFISQIELANKYNLPVSIHARDALQDTYDILNEYKVLKGGSMHCYSGSLEMAKLFTKLGFKIGVGGVVTFKNSAKLKDVVQNLSIDDLIVETDGPYLAPHPYRGKLNEPKYIKLVALEIAKLKNLDSDFVIKKLEENTLKLFSRENNYARKIKN